ncbi:MAG: acetyl-CoA C-acyltransferase [Candidatus Melainabacteria bacterium]
MTRTAYIVDAVRTPIGKYGGLLKDIRPDDLAACTLSALMARNPGVAPALIEDVLLGAANQAGEDNRNVARMAALLAGFPVTVPGGTVNRLCGSGLMAVNQAAHAIMAGEADCLIAGGVESMTRAPWVLAKTDQAFSRQVDIVDTTIGWRFTNPRLAAMHFPFGMGETAENVAEHYKISREDQDAFALASQQKAQHAIEAGLFDAEIIPVPLPGKRKGDEPPPATRDEHPRFDCSAADLARLKPAFKDGGTVTAGNASGINDGASALLLVSEAFLKTHNLTPMARVVSTAVAGVDPAMMGIGPVPATRLALKKAGLTVDDLGLTELNEAFASQSLACIRDLGLDVSRINVNGGAIALGHPLGASGARILTTLLHTLKRRETEKYGLATMCVGVGQGIATIVESCN